MPESRLPADQQRRLAISFGLSLLIHAVAWNLLGSSGLPPSAAASKASPPSLTVSLLAAISPAPIQEEPAAPAVPPPLQITSPPAPAPKPGPSVAAAPGPAPAESASRSIDAAAGLSGVVSGPWYYPARYLHRRPTPLRPIRPDYPPQANDVSGRVVLLLFINEKGTVDSHRILKAEPPRLFEDAVISAFVGERYAPGLILAQAVKSQLLLEVFFEYGTGARVNVLADPAR